MAEKEEDIIAAGAEIIWVMEQDQGLQPGTADNCRSTMNNFGSDQGWCVGDSETQPTAGTFDDSPFSQGRGFDILVTLDDMVIQFSTNHGTPSGNDNWTGQDVLDAVVDELGN